MPYYVYFKANTNTFSLNLFINILIYFVSYLDVTHSLCELCPV